MRRAVFIVLLSALVAGCVDGPDLAEQEAAKEHSFCITHPSRVLDELTWPDAPGIDGNMEAAKVFMRMSVDDPEEQAPAAIRASFLTYAQAIQAWEPGADPLLDPAVRAAKQEVDRWLLDRCGPPTVGTIPVGMIPMGTIPEPSLHVDRPARPS